MDAHLLAVDWGTSSLRVEALGPDGTVLDSRTSSLGMAIAGDAEGGFAKALQDTAGADWLAGEVPVLMCGMVGAKGGWLEVPYVSCPASLADVAAGIARVKDAGCEAWIVPGLAQSAGPFPEVMRGEETQVFGALQASGRDEGLFVLPGTHSKWVQVAGGSIRSFATYMTGDFYRALAGSTVLAKTIDTNAGFSVKGFRRGTQAGSELGGAGELMHAAFAVRALGLFDRLEPAAAGSYLSGLLVGAELAAGSKRFGTGEATVIGSPEQAERYMLAGDVLGMQLPAADANAAAAGLAQIAQSRGLVRAGSVR